MITLPALFMNIWFRRAVLVVALIIAYFAWQRHQRNIGAQNGIQQESQQVAVQQQASQKSDRETVVPQLQVLTQQIMVLAQATQSLQSDVNAIRAQRQQIPVQVAGMSQAQVLDAINQMIGHVGQSSLTADDMRKILEGLKQGKACDDEVAKLEEVARSLRAEQDKQNVRFVTLAAYTSRVERNYTDLWNDKAQPKRKWYCLYICKKKPSIQYPDPQDLLREKPAN